MININAQNNLTHSSWENRRRKNAQNHSYVSEKYDKQHTNKDIMEAIHTLQR
jgi:hypothetical protein